MLSTKKAAVYLRLSNRKGTLAKKKKIYHDEEFSRKKELYKEDFTELCCLFAEMLHEKNDLAFSMIIKKAPEAP